MANIITGIRVLFSLILLFTKAFSPTFYALYIIAGMSDVLDGIVARKLNLKANSAKNSILLLIFALLAQLCIN